MCQVYTLYLLMKQLIPCFRMRSTFSFIFSFSANSISATFAVESTRTLEPKIYRNHTQRQTAVLSIIIIIKKKETTTKKNFQQKTRGAVEDLKLHLDLVCVHASVGNKDVCVLNPFGLINTDLLVK